MYLPCQNYRAVGKGNARQPSAGQPTYFHLFSLGEACYPILDETKLPNCSDPFNSTLTPLSCLLTYWIYKFTKTFEPLR